MVRGDPGSGSWIDYLDSRICSLSDDSIAFGWRGWLYAIGAFISALMMVGIVTIPVEIKYFGKKLTIYRNALAFIFSFVVALVIGMVMSL